MREDLMTFSEICLKSKRLPGKKRKGKTIKQKPNMSDALHFQLVKGIFLIQTTEIFLLQISHTESSHTASREFKCMCAHISQIQLAGVDAISAKIWISTSSTVTVHRRRPNHFRWENYLSEIVYLSDASVPLVYIYVYVV